MFTKGLISIHNVVCYTSTKHNPLCKSVYGHMLKSL